MSALIKLLRHFISTGDAERASMLAYQIWHNRGSVFDHRWVIQGEFRMASTGERAITALDADGATCLFPESYFMTERAALAVRDNHENVTLDTMAAHADKCAEFRRYR